VQVHTDQLPARSAEAEAAEAYTAGAHVVFGAGRYAPESRDGQHLLAHELAHVVQQENADTTGLARIADPRGERVLIDRRERRDKSSFLQYWGLQARPTLPPTDWFEEDQVNWRRDVGNWPNTANTFVNAAVYNTKNNLPGEYQTIFERSEYYGVINALLYQDAATKDVRFFAAASKVTSSEGVGAVEAPAGGALHSPEAITVLTEVNKILFEANMKIINKLIGGHQPTDPRNPAATTPITPMAFDLDMVETEQGLVETYLKGKTISTQAKRDINDDLNLKGVVRTVGGLTLDTKSFDWARVVLSVKELDFMIKDHRVAIGKALVFIFHGRTLDDYKKYWASAQTAVP